MIPLAPTIEKFNFYKKEIYLLFGSAIVIIFLTHLAILSLEGLDFASRWVIQSVIVLIIVFIQIVVRLDKNRLDNNSPRYSSLGWGNRITIIRGVLIAALAGFLFQSWPVSILIWMPGILYIMAAVIDRIDGYLARKTNMQSQLGEELDTVYDAIGLLVAPLLAVEYGQLHWSYLLVSIAYYAFILGINYRKKRGLRVYELAANISRRTIAGFQMGFVAAVLLPVFHPPITQLAGIAFMAPLLVGFIIDWSVVSGRLTEGSKIISLLDQLKLIGLNVLLPGLRLLTVLLAISLFINSTLQLTNSLKDNVVIVLAVITLLFILTGITARIASAILAIIMGFYYQDQSLTIDAALLLFCAIWIMMLGAGRFSLIKWDEDWVNRYDGA